MTLSLSLSLSRILCLPRPLFSSLLLLSLLFSFTSHSIILLFNSIRSSLLHSLQFLSSLLLSSLLLSSLFLLSFSSPLLSPSLFSLRFSSLFSLRLSSVASPSPPPLLSFLTLLLRCRRSPLSPILLPPPSRLLSTPLSLPTHACARWTAMSRAAWWARGRTPRSSRRRTGRPHRRSRSSCSI